MLRVTQTRQGATDYNRSASWQSVGYDANNIISLLGFMGVDHLLALADLHVGVDFVKVPHESQAWRNREQPPSS